MDEPQISAWRGRIGDVPALLKRLEAARAGAPVQLVRADRVYGTDHLRLAARLAARAIAEGRGRAADLPTETVLYAAGERQIGRALKLLGLEPGAQGVAALAWGSQAEGALARFAEAEGWTRDDALLEGSNGVLDAFGVTPVERAMFPRERWGDLVLERVALTDVLKA